MNDIKKLIQLGFEEVGHWEINKDYVSGLNFQINKFHKERIIYAFTTTEVVWYIGICEANITKFKKRLERYRSLAGGGTNERIANMIKSLLNNGFKVNILALKPSERHQVKINGIEVDLVKGMELGIAKYVNARLNRRK